MTWIVISLCITVAILCATIVLLVWRSDPGSEWDVFDEGYEVAEMGQSSSRCPYPRGTVGAAEWMRGYSQALADYEKWVIP